MNIAGHLGGGGAPFSEIRRTEIEVVVLQREAGVHGFFEKGIAIGGVEPGATPVERNSERLVNVSTPDAIHGLEHAYRKSVFSQVFGRAQAGRPRTMTIASVDDMSHAP